MGNSPSIEKSADYSLPIPGHGTLQGLTIYENDKPRTHRFANIRYALAPIGANRWKLPIPVPLDYDYSKDDHREFALKSPQPAIEDPNFKHQYYKSPTSEDITHLNVWVPADDTNKPKEGWPVLFYIHGGWLQYGAPNQGAIYDPRDLHDATKFQEQFIIVSPGYRINLFGFLSGKELLEEDSESTNFGFWDQRMALEWTADNIEYFGGDKNKISVGGVSAGSYSTFFQLAYEVYHPELRQLIKQLIFWSNNVWIQPKTLEELQGQFDELLQVFEIDPTLSDAEKLAALRALDAELLVDKIPEMKMHTFRAVTDDKFISSKLLEDLVSGVYGAKLKERKMRIMIGEVDNEGVKYSLLNTPKSMSELPLQLANYYPARITDTLMEVYPKIEVDESDPAFKDELRVLYGKMISDGQVYASSRGFLDCIVKGGFPVEDIFRYQSAFRTKYLDQYVDPKHKVPHGCDVQVWFFALQMGILPEEEAPIIEYITPYCKFLHYKTNEEIDWGTSKIEEHRVMCSDGKTRILEDDQWQWGIKVAKAVYSSQVESN